MLNNSSPLMEFVFKNTEVTYVSSSNKSNHARFKWNYPHSRIKSFVLYCSSFRTIAPNSIGLCKWSNGLLVFYICTTPCIFFLMCKIWFQKFLTCNFYSRARQPTAWNIQMYILNFMSGNSFKGPWNSLQIWTNFMQLVKHESFPTFSSQSLDH